MFDRIEKENNITLSHAAKVAGLKASAAKKFVVTTVSNERYNIWALSAARQAEYAGLSLDENDSLWALDPSFAHPADHAAIEYRLDRAVREGSPVVLFRINEESEVVEQSEQKITGFHIA